MSNLLLSLSVLICLCLISGEAQACECVEYETPVCAAFWRADAVFVGRLVDIKPLQNPPDKDLRYVSLHFRVEQPYRGLSGLDVYVGTTSGNMCDLRFKKGQRYIVYAWRQEDSNHLLTGFCSRTKLLKYAKEDLDYIRTVTQHSAQETISGKIMGGESWRGLPALKVTIENAGKTFETTTDSHGDFFFSLPGPGTFKVRVFVPFEAEVLRYADPTPVKTDATKTLTTLSYDLKLDRNQCHYTQLNVFRL